MDLAAVFVIAALVGYGITHGIVWILDILSSKR